VGITGRANTGVGLKMRKIWVYVVSNSRNRFYLGLSKSTEPA